MASRALARPRDAELLEEVLALSLELLAAGVYPSSYRLARRLPDVDHRKVHRYRQRLVEAGRLTLPPAPNRRVPDRPRPARAVRRTLQGATPEERAEVAARIDEVRAEKVARGEEPCRPAWEIPVVRDHRRRP